MLPGETVATGASSKCPDCGKQMELEVCESAAGYFLGYRCGQDGVSTRETRYYKNGLEAVAAFLHYQDTGELLGART